MKTYTRSRQMPKPETEPQFVGCTGALLKPFMDTRATTGGAGLAGGRAAFAGVRKDYGPQGCAGPSARALGILGLLVALVFKSRKRRRNG